MSYIFIYLSKATTCQTYIFCLNESLNVRLEIVTLAVHK